MKATLLAAAAVLALAVAAPAAKADAILTFGQVGGANTLTAVANGTGTQTTITGTDIPVNITQILGSSPTTADFTLAAHSTNAAQSLGNGAFQHFAGTFSFTSGAGGTGTNYLSGSFTDILLGTNTSAVLSASAPPDTITFTSDVIHDLSLPRAISLALANVTPGISIDGSTLGSFRSSVSGTVSANAAAVPEPATLALLGVGLLGLGVVRGRRVA